VNLRGDIKHTKKKKYRKFIGTSKEIGLEVNTEKTKYMLVPHQQAARAKS
jgi:hypothetical protein